MDPQALQIRGAPRTAFVTPDFLVDDAPLRITYYPGRSDRVVVTFNSADHNSLGNQPDEFFGIARAGAVQNHVISVSDRLKSWFSMPGMQDRIVQVVRDKIDAIGAARVMTLGSSMGGHGALLFAERIGADRAMSFVPQFTMSPNIKERRWTQFRPHMVEANLHSLHRYLTGKTEAFCFFGGDCRHDRRHMKWIERRCVATCYVLDGFTHELPLELKARGLLDRFLMVAMTADRAQLDALVAPLLVPQDPENAREGGTSP